PEAEPHRAPGLGADPAADPLGGLEHHHVEVAEVPGGSEPGDPAADDDDVTGRYAAHSAADINHLSSSAPARRARAGGRMFVNRMPRFEVLDEDAVATLERGWRRILTDVGVAFGDPEAIALLRAAGQRVEGDVAF